MMFLLQLLEKIVENFEMLIGSFTHVDREFTRMIWVTKSFKSVESMSVVPGNMPAMNAKVYWTTLHSLLHSERNSYRHHGYFWLGDLLIAEISEEGNLSLLSIKSLEKKIKLAGVNDYSDSLDVPLPVWLMCGLLKSKNSHIRWGFLFVLERLLMRSKILLDENEEVSSQSTAHALDENRLEKANAVIDIMSHALSLMALDETDRINILKVIVLTVIYDNCVILLLLGSCLA